MARVTIGARGFVVVEILKIRASGCVSTTIVFDDQTLEVRYENRRLRIAADNNNYVIIKLKSQHVAYKATILGGFVLSEEMTGELDYGRYLVVDWEDDISVPELVFQQSPRQITRSYEKGQWIELGMEDISRYHVMYDDGVEATFERRADDGFEFSFSTGFYGSFWKDPDGSHTLKFKGDRLKPTEEPYRSQSKFIVSRSPYSDLLLLILQDRATVRLG